MTGNKDREQGTGNREQGGDAERPSHSLKQIAVAVVRDGNRYLIGQRPPGVPLAGLWEFPGGKVRSDESPAEAAVRECREETGLEITIDGEYPRVEHTYDHGRLMLHFFAARPHITGAEPTSPFRWMPAGDLDRLEFPAANAGILKALRAESELRNSTTT